MVFTACWRLELGLWWCCRDSEQTIKETEASGPAAGSDGDGPVKVLVSPSSRLNSAQSDTPERTLTPVFSSHDDNDVEDDKAKVVEAMTLLTRLSVGQHL